MNASSSWCRFVCRCALRVFVALFVSFAGVAFASLPGSAAAQSQDVVVADAWARMAPNHKNGASFMTIENRRAADIVIVAATSPAARVVELHEMAMDGDVMRMRKVAQILVGAHARVTLKPGGLHVMLIDLVKPLVAGEAVPVTLRLADGTEVAVSAPVRPMGGH